MRTVVIVITVTLSFAGMLPGKAEARCCNVAGIPMCGMVCWNQNHPTIAPYSRLVLSILMRMVEGTGLSLPRR
jgi:hypothetical protein